MPKILAWEGSIEEKISTLFTVVHTWKGTFGQLGMQYIVKELHKLEEVLTRLREAGTYEISEITESLASYQGETLYSWLVHELESLKVILGNQFFLQKDMVSIEKVKINQMRETVEQLPDCLQKEQIILELETLHYKPFHELLQSYPEYVVKLAERYDKSIESFSILGGQRLINTEIYHDFSQNLAHVFRNAVVHGLETTDERLEAGKKEKGVIRCEVIESTETLTVRIVDDGRGIDIEKMKKLAVEKNIMDEETARTLSDEEARSIIFVDGFSTAVCVDDIAGRGVGLYSIRKEVEKMGGEIRVDSQIGLGTAFSFVLPLETAVYNQR